ncbi:MAG: malto-oligosyltrehalose synthase [Reyranella sp.]|jgi:malto-oligosyltrehalose synthase|uniref:malto-oligosyltrehalose synthase n=1 Tax=Reyranella sp. TaxID=1929291 RepID=UPI0025EB86F4|nr:malto-oligosyltrehalose synthase [Reyranella sp.]MBR2819028.1 malto-oligosyltrehalose synthase [Reyranella sp.]
MTPRATLRLQFHGDFTFADATRHIDRYAALGVSHIYASPLATARAGSMHGYDVVDPTRIAPALGGEESLRTFAAALRDAGLGLILDIVPNHMAADLGNGWWRDVLQWGRASRYAAWFDIDWNAPGTNGKVLLPVLGGPLDETLARKPPKLGRDGEGRPALLLGGQTWPLAEGTERNAQDLRGLLAQQHYLLVPWRVAGDRLNWRRFFDINELVCLRMEEPEAFEAVHALPLRLFAEGIVDGLRVDHVDGLTDPAGYCRTLRGRLDAIATQRRRSRAWLVVEKILFDGEALPTEWRVDGTTGYDFMNDVSALQHDPDSAAGLGEAWARLSGRPADFAPEEQAARREIVARSFSAQLDACAASFERLLDAAVPRPTLRRLLTDILVHMPAYRTYGSKGVLSATDRVLLGRVGKAVKRTCLATDRWAAAPLIAAMQTPPASTPKLPLWDKAMARLQQLSAPIAAKAVEDTGFYRYGRLLSRNDVGFDTALLGLEPVAFHGRVAARQAALPHAMVTTATHDHKRGEDLRARLATLSECAPEWTQLQSRWIAACEPLCRPVRGRLAPSAGDIAMLLQMLVGGWPIDLAPADKAGRARLAERLAAWQQKALREAKLETDWADIDPAYEEAAQHLTHRLVAEAALPDLLQEIAGFAQRLAPAGAVNALAQCLLKLTVPGVPDIYQGCDLWDFSFVDPDNRRPVDFTAHAADETADLSQLAEAWRDGRIKRHLIRRALGLRAAAPELFARGDYHPLEVEGEGARSIVAFVRSHGPDWMLVIAPRLMLDRLVPGRLAAASDTWKGTTLRLDEMPPSLPLYDWLGGGLVELLHRTFKADLLVGTLPLALVSSIVPDWSEDC